MDCFVNNYSGAVAAATSKMAVLILCGARFSPWCEIQRPCSVGKGVYTGSKPRLTPLQTAELVARVGMGHGKAQIARDMGISRKTLYNYVDRL